MTEQNDSSIYGLAIGVGFLSFFTILLILPPWYWHLRNRNIGAVVLVTWVIYLNFQTFLNAIIWPSEISLSNYQGEILCDIQTKIAPAAAVGVPIALACIFRGLAAVLNPDQSTVMISAARQKRERYTQLAICIILPILHMVLLYVIQDFRYALIAISGCVPSLALNSVSIVCILVMPLLYTAVGAFFAVLVLIRLAKYRASLGPILQHSNLSKTRFMRLYILCAIFLLGIVAVQLFVLWVNLQGELVTYDWKNLHSLNSRILVLHNYSALLYDRWIWLAQGWFIFFFFGLGQEAVAMYRTAIIAAHLKCLLPIFNIRTPSLRSQASIKSLSEKVKGFFGHSSSSSTATQSTQPPPYSSGSHVMSSPDCGCGTPSMSLDATVMSEDSSRGSVLTAEKDKNKNRFLATLSGAGDSSVTSVVRSGANNDWAEDEKGVIVRTEVKQVASSKFSTSRTDQG